MKQSKRLQIELEMIYELHDIYWQAKLDHIIETTLDFYVEGLIESSNHLPKIVKNNLIYTNRALRLELECHHLEETLKYEDKVYSWNRDSKNFPHVTQITYNYKELIKYPKTYHWKDNGSYYGVREDEQRRYGL